MFPNLSAHGSRREFSPLYVGSGDESEDRLAFFHVLERLKIQKRTGWVLRGIPCPESISDHMYRMSILAMCSNDTKLDNSKCVLMCLVHDLAEAQVGDIAPGEGISKEAKKELEADAMLNFVHVMLHGTPAALRIESLWKEYEEQNTAEAQFVKDLDRFEVVSQALEYERRYPEKRLDDFYENTVSYIRHPEIKKWSEDLMAERERMMQERNQVS